MRCVIAISGNIGSGKTTLAAGLAELLQCRPAICEDDLNTTQDRSLQAMRQWMDRGGDVGEFDLSNVVLELNNRGLQSPDSSIVLETQFGRCHPQLNPLIDVQCWIDVPRDVALARKLAQWSRELQHPELTMTMPERLSWIEGFCQGYLQVIRELLDWQDQRLRPAADIIVDGAQSPQSVARQLWQQLQQFELAEQSSPLRKRLLSESAFRA